MIPETTGHPKAKAWRLGDGPNATSARRIREPKPSRPTLTEDGHEAMAQVRNFLLATDPK